MAVLEKKETLPFICSLKHESFVWFAVATHACKIVQPTLLCPTLVRTRLSGMPNLTPGIQWLTRMIM